MFNKYKASNLYLESSFFLPLILMQRIERIVWCFLNLVSCSLKLLVVIIVEGDQWKISSLLPSILRPPPCRRINRLARSRVIKLTWEAGRIREEFWKVARHQLRSFLATMLIGGITFLPGRKTGISLSSVTRSKFATFSAEFGKLGEELRLLSSLYGKIVKFLPQIYLRDVRIALNGTVK